MENACDHPNYEVINFYTSLNNKKLVCTYEVCLKCSKLLITSEATQLNYLH